MPTRLKQNIGSKRTTPDPKLTLIVALTPTLTRPLHTDGVRQLRFSNDDTLVQTKAIKHTRINKKNMGFSV